MKASILSAAGFVSAATAAAAADLFLGFFGTTDCAPIHEFNFANVPSDRGDCFNFPNPIFGSSAARLQSCTGFQCRCTIFEARDCNSGPGFVQVNFEDGSSQDCKSTGGATFQSASCDLLRKFGSGR